jgi:hypothetical protein
LSGQPSDYESRAQPPKRASVPHSRADGRKALTSRAAQPSALYLSLRHVAQGESPIHKGENMSTRTRTSIIEETLITRQEAQRLLTQHAVRLVDHYFAEGVGEPEPLWALLVGDISSQWSGDECLLAVDPTDCPEMLAGLDDRPFEAQLVRLYEQAGRDWAADADQPRALKQLELLCSASYDLHQFLAANSQHTPAQLLFWRMYSTTSPDDDARDAAAEFWNRFGAVPGIEPPRDALAAWVGGALAERRQPV